MSVLGRWEERAEREGLAHVFAFPDLVHPELLVLGRGHGRRLRSGAGRVQQGVVAASALVAVPAVCESCLLLGIGSRDKISSCSSIFYLWATTGLD